MQRIDLDSGAKGELLQQFPVNPVDTGIRADIVPGDHEGRELIHGGKKDISSHDRGTEPAGEQQEDQTPPGGAGGGHESTPRGEKYLDLLTKVEHFGDSRVLPMAFLNRLATSPDQCRSRSASVV